MNEKLRDFTELSIDPSLSSSRALPEGSIEPIDMEEFETDGDRLAEELAEYLGTDAPILSDYAVSREGIYEDDRSL